ncbi:MAG: 5'/3'-nucleotidase SurE [Planctomycetota bacterium]
MRILISNDDGIHARGIALLTMAARRAFGDEADIVVIAPAEERSGYSHRISLGELHVDTVDPREAMAHEPGEPTATTAYRVDGTPADCVRLALARGGPLDRARSGFFASRNMPRATTRPAADWLPDLVLAGVNHGANFGHDLHYSGTVGVAAEAAGFGVPAVAFSRLRQSHDMILDEVGPLADVVSALLVAWLEDGTLSRERTAPGGGNVLLNVNFPTIHASEYRGVRVTRVAGYCYAEHFERTGRAGRVGRGDGVDGVDGVDGDYLAIREGSVASEDLPPGSPDVLPGNVWTDEQAVRENFVSVTPLTIDWTRYAHLGNLGSRCDDWWGRVR